MAKEVLLKTKTYIEAATPYPPSEIDLNFKYMFGGMAAYAKGKIFAIIMGEDIAFKLPPDAVEDAKSEGGKQWEYTDKHGRTVSMSTYMIMPQSIVHDADKCNYWMQLAIDHVAVQPAKPSRPRKKPSKPVEPID